MALNAICSGFVAVKFHKSAAGSNKAYSGDVLNLQLTHRVTGYYHQLNRNLLHSD
ncbi:hypothetical protein ACTXT7_016591 [Hymenolepis weldensis]